MGEDGIQESAEFPVEVLSEDSWKQMRKAVREEGERAAAKEKQEGHHFEVAVIGPRTVLVGESVKLKGLRLPLDWRLAKRREMVAMAQDFAQAAYECGLYSPALSVLLGAVIEGKSIDVNE